MTAKYRTRINFTFTSLKACETALNKLRRHYILFNRSSQNGVSDIGAVNEWEKRLIGIVCEDLNMPGLVDGIWRLIESSDIANSDKVAN